MQTLERLTLVTTPGAEAYYSPHGHLITADGTTYALCHRYHHGVVLALLFPEAFAAYDPAVNDRRPKPSLDVEVVDALDIFAFQDFEMECAGTLPVIRFCESRASMPSVDLPNEAVTPAQHEALRSLLIATQGHGPRTEVSTALRDTTVLQCLDWATKPKDERC